MRTAQRVTAAILMACALEGVTASADCTFDIAQDIAVFSTHWNDVLLYNYSNTGLSAVGPAFGSRDVGYAAPKEQWLGAFLYDYALGAYVEAQYSNVDQLFEIA